MTTGLRFFYRHIYTTGLENIPANGPVVIIANHNSSLMDAALLGILLKRKAWFFARGDVFINKLVQKLLWWFHMMPVHSHQGGKKTLQANDSSFSSGRQILSKGGIIVFFPESSSHTEHRLLPFRKGVFRLAFETATANNFATNIPIVPVGITYDHPIAGRTTVAVHAGKPVMLNDYADQYKNNSAAALLHICRDAHQAIAQLVLHVDDQQRLETTEHCLVISRNNQPKETAGWKVASRHKLNAEREICIAINNTDAGAFNSKQAATNKYFKTLSANQLSDKTISGRLSFAWWNMPVLVIGFPFFLMGCILNGLPIVSARWIVNKKVYRRDFYSWIFVACYSLKYFLWMLLLLLLAFFLLGWQYAIGLWVVMTLTGIFAYAYKGWLEDWNQYRKWQSLTTAKINELTAMRSRI